MMRTVYTLAGIAFVAGWMLLLGELWAREVYVHEVPAPSRPDEIALPAELVQADEHLGRGFRPNTAKFFASPHGEFAVHYQINEIGLRESGTIFPGDRPPYVLVLGDSFVEGWGVMGEATFIREIQRRLRQRDDMDRYTRLFNAGMSGYGAAQSYLLGRRLFNTLGADVFVLVYTGLMPAADFHFLAHATLDNDGIALNAGTPNVKRVATFSRLDAMLGESALFQTAATYFDAWQARASLVPGDLATDLFAATRGSVEAAAPLHQRSLAHVAALARFAQANGAQFILVHVPLPHQVAPDEWAEGRSAYQLAAERYPAPEEEIIDEFCTAERLHCVLTTQMFRDLAEATTSRVYFRYDYTLTPVGHRALVTHLMSTIHTALSSVETVPRHGNLYGRSRAARRTLDTSQAEKN